MNRWDGWMRADVVDSRADVRARGGRLGRMGRGIGLDGCREVTRGKPEGALRARGRRGDEEDARD